MLLHRLRFLFIFLVLGFAVFLSIKQQYQLAIPLFIAAALLMIIHFAFNTVTPALKKLNEGKVDEAEDLLDMIKRPEWLYKGHRANYHFAKGIIALQRKELDLAETALNAAYDTGLRTNNQKSMTLLNIAHINFVQKNFEKALHFLQKSKSHQPSDLMIKKKLEEMELVLQKKMN